MAALLAASFIPGGRYWRSFVYAVLLFLGLGAVVPLLVDKRLIFDLNLLRLDGLIQFFATLMVVAVGLRWISVADTGRDLTTDGEVGALSGALLLCSCLFGVGPAFVAVVLGGRLVEEVTGHLEVADRSETLSVLSGRVEAWLRQPNWFDSWVSLARPDHSCRQSAQPHTSPRSNRRRHGFSCSGGPHSSQG